MKLIWLFFSVMFVIGTDTFLLSPLLPLLQDQFHVSTDLSGWMVSAYALGYALFALAAGPISDRFNRKTVMLSGLAGFILSTFLCGIAPSFAAMCTFRFAAGVSAAFVTPQIWASIPVIVHPSKVLKSMGIATAGLAASQMLGLPIGGFLASFTWHTPFFVLSAGSLVLLFILAAAMPDIRPAEAAAHRSSLVSPYRELFSLPKTSMILLAYFLFQTGNFATFSFLGTWLFTDYHLTVSQIGAAMLVLGLGNMLGSLIGSKIASKLGTFKTLISGMLLMGALYFSLPFFPNLLIVEASFFLTFFIAGIIFPLMMGIFQSISPNARGTIASLSNAAMYAGTTVGTCLAGLLYQNTHHFGAVTAFTAILFVLSMALYQTSRKNKPQAAGFHVKSTS
ncbi:MFS transporter [Bacillus halotolerans]|uniref:MFS transporter n=1 Tax=Bacillus halotolerans TaxID=260554 RepID=UPI0024055929|nr:MFS transporter [Bacillus halotolerans]MDG0767491.1 MFS transporter [Bacillus halotolerans]